MNAIIAKAEQQEKALQFRSFTPETALAAGMLLADRAKAENLALAVDIRVNGHEWFHYSAPGTAPNNDEWMRMKRNTVERFRISSYLFGLYLQRDGKTMQDHKLDEKEYAQYGGGFPIIVRNAGVVGCIAVSGLKDDEDHAIIVWALEKLLAGQQ